MCIWDSYVYKKGIIIIIIIIIIIVIVIVIIMLNSRYVSVNITISLKVEFSQVFFNNLMSDILSASKYLLLCICWPQISAAVKNKS